MSDDLVSKRSAERCTTHSHACDCREYAHAKYTADLLAEIERLRVVGADLQAARERAYDNRDMALQAVEEAERERDLWKSQVHDEIAANLAFRAAGGALQDEDMPTFCARIIAERDALRARIEEAAVAWAGVAQNGLWYAGQDWRDSAHVKLHLSGFGDAEDQKSIKTCRVALVVVDE
jgi:hypothetical protein